MFVFKVREGQARKNTRKQPGRQAETDLPAM